MRIAVTAATLLFALASCSTSGNPVSPYLQPNSLMDSEINQRIDQIPFQHRDELVQNLLWLNQTGEQTIPALLRGLKSENPKVRSSCCWVLGRLRDRRTVDNLRQLVTDDETSVRLEASRTLVLMGDLDQSPRLIEGLDSERKEVRYMCHEALKSATGHDFGYDHLNPNQLELQLAVLRWRQWWGEYGGDTFFAASYQKENGLNSLAAPGGETKPNDESSPVPEAPQPDAGQAEAQTEEAQSPASIPAVIPTPESGSAAAGEQSGAAGQGSEGSGAVVEVPTTAEVPVVAPPVVTPVVKPVVTPVVTPVTGNGNENGNGGN